MKTKPIMYGSSILLLGLGIGFTFMPEELAIWLGSQPSALELLLLQVMGALYVGFGALNWMQKSSLIGGIYNRPLVLGNFAHFMIGGLALVKAAFLPDTQSPAVWAVTVIYAVFALLFGWLMLRHPLPKE